MVSSRRLGEADSELERCNVSRCRLKTNRHQARPSFAKQSLDRSVNLREEDLKERKYRTVVAITQNFYQMKNCE